jgi:hypothetical protein
MNDIMISVTGAETGDVLIDYDPSSTTLEQTSIHRFMALDLIHHARCDIESMFCVLVWFVLCYLQCLVFTAGSNPEAHGGQNDDLLAASFYAFRIMPPAACCGRTTRRGGWTR